MNPFKDINWNPQAADLRKFAWSLVIGFPCLAVLFFCAKWLKTGAMPSPEGFLKLAAVGVIVGLICLAVPLIAKPLYYVWYAIAGCIGFVMGNLIFGLMFYAVFTPIGLVMRLIGRDPLQLKQKQASSHWIDAPPQPPAARYFTQH